MFLLLFSLIVLIAILLTIHLSALSLYIDDSVGKVQPKLEAEIESTFIMYEDMGDAENVHESEVQESIKASFAKLKSLPAADVTRSASLNKVLEWAQSSAPDKGSKVARVLDEMEEVDEYNVNCDIKELELLRMVVARIEWHNDPTRQNLREALVQQLFECYEHRKVLCHVGRFARVINSLAIIDEGMGNVAERPRWALEQELMAKAGKLQAAGADMAGASLADALIKDYPRDEHEKIREIVSSWS